MSIQTILIFLFEEYATVPGLRDTEVSQVTEHRPPIFSGGGTLTFELATF